MAALLLIVIYLAFISLGLPDSLLGAAWPVAYQDLNVPISYMGIVSMIVSACTIVSALFSDKLILKLGTRWVTVISIFITAFAMLGFYLADNFVLLCFIAVPYGLGAGAIDSTLNNYVALHYSSRSMSWLHCFWGVGALAGPFAMSYAISGHGGWHAGYLIIGTVQIVIGIIVLVATPLWDKVKHNGMEGSAEEIRKLTFRQKFSIPGIMFVLFGFLAYCSLESTSMYWASSFLVKARGITEERAAMFASLLYIGIAGGRFLSGFFANRLGDRNIMRLGYGIIVIGLILVIIPAGEAVTLTGLVLTGFGCAPIYPAIIHSTPSNFGPENSGAVIGLQMAFSYIGTTLASPLFGLIAGLTSFDIYPFYLAFFLILSFVMMEILNRKVDCRKNRMLNP